jgi:hypothetical protein
VKLPNNVIIPDAKITQYLLVFREQDDKSKFLAKGGFNQNNSEQLKLAIYKLIQNNEAIEDLTNEYGTFYQVIGELIGINGQNLLVITIWLKRDIDNQFQFITLKPKKEKKP